MNLSEMLRRPTALVVVDLQNDYCHPEGSFAKRGANLVPGFPEQVCSRLQALLTAARVRDTPTFFIRTEHGPWSNAPSWLERLRGTRSATELPVCAEGGWGAEFFGVLPCARDRIVVKHRYSAFVDTPLPLYLRSAGVETLLITGVATNVCVESTARDAFMRDYRVVTVSDCCAANSIEEHEAALGNLGRYFGLVSDSAAIISAWSGRVDAQSPLATESAEPSTIRSSDGSI